MKQCFIVLDYPSIAALAAVIREGSFERAAAALRITPSAVSQRVRGLEERMGAILVVRGQPCTPTSMGRTLCAHLDQVRLLEHDIAPALGGSQDDERATLTIPIAVNADSLATWFPAALAEFGREGGVSLRLTLDDEGHTADRLRTGEVLAAVTADPATVQGCKTGALGIMRYVACASPDFIARHFSNGMTGEALSIAPHLRFEPRDIYQDRWARDAHGVDLIGPVHWIPSTHGFIDLAIAGLGWGMHPIGLVEKHLANGSLVELSPNRKMDIKLYWTAVRLHSALLKGLTDAVRDAARQLVRT